MRPAPGRPTSTAARQAPLFNSLPSAVMAARSSLSYTLYLSRHGESEANVQGILGGDTGLSARGQAYSRRLCELIGESPGDTPVWTSALRRTLETVRPLQRSHDENNAASTYPHSIRPGLNEIDAGVCDGLTEADALARFPDVMHGRNADKLRFRYPKGESYVDLMERVGRECAAFDAELQSRAKNRSGSGSHNPKTQGW